MTNRAVRSLLQVAVAALLLGGLYLARSHTKTEPVQPAGRSQPASDPTVPNATVPAPAPVSRDGTVGEAFRARRSDVELEAAGRVTRVLPDDREGARHERFLVRIGTVTVLVAHNLDLAPRVPVSPGDSVELRGEYEWNAKGGVLHWTHRDPAGRHEAGWIRHRGRLYH